MTTVKPPPPPAPPPGREIRDSNPVIAVLFIVLAGVAFVGALAAVAVML